LKKALMVALSVALVTGSMFAPAQGKKKKKPVATSLFLHGQEQIGETELEDTWINGNWMTMDETEGEGPQKSRFVTNYILGPNTQCSGNSLYPVWKGALSGTVVGDVTVTLHTVATPAAKLAIQLYPDGAGGCDSAVSMDFVPPATETVVDVPPGPGVVEAVLPNTSFEVVGSLVLQVYIADQGTSPAQVRLFYDSKDSASGVSLSLVPK
jgi:hypothetical protein